MDDTLKGREPHPSAESAMRYIASIPMQQLMLYREAFASCAIEGNRLGEICVGTLNRLLNNDQVSDRYLLGLAWAIKTMNEIEVKNG